MDQIPVDCCVNDEHGNTINEISAIHFPGLDLDAASVRGVHFREVSGQGFYVSRWKMTAQHLRSCVGNIFWERYVMEPWSASACLHRLRDSKLFSLDGGDARLCDWFDSAITDHAHVRALLIENAKDDRL